MLSKIVAVSLASSASAFMVPGLAPMPTRTAAISMQAQPFDFNELLHDFLGSFNKPQEANFSPEELCRDEESSGCEVFDVEDDVFNGKHNPASKAVHAKMGKKGIEWTPAK